MPRKKPTLKLGTYGHFDINPENAVGLYWESKKQNNYFIKEPDWDLAREGLQLYAVHNDQEFFEMKESQEIMRKQAAIQQKLNKEQINDIYKMQESLRQKFVTVNEFLQECKEKEIQANYKISLEKEKHIELKDKIVTLELSWNELQEFKESMKKSVTHLKIYEDVIETVVKDSDLFNSTEDLMNRCDALMSAQNEISMMEQEKINAIEEIRKQLVKKTNEAASAVIGLTNELTQLEKSYNIVKSASLKWEKILASTKDYIVNEEFNFNRMLDSIQHLYKLFCKRNKEEPIFNRLQIEEQLDYIKEEVKILKEVLKESRAYMMKEQKTLLCEKGTKSKSLQK